MAYNKTSEERKRQAKKLYFLFIWSDDLCFGCSSDRSDALTAELKADGYEVISGPRTTGDGYYESCIVAVEDNQIEITV